jgi:murein DD-endopeptidase MepM/ murein hydrolase activator NlpD
MQYPILKKPLKYCVATQPFGVNWTGMPDAYSRWGLKNHNGEDYKIRPKDEFIRAAHNGTILQARFDESGFGNFIELLDESETFKTRYGHGAELLRARTNKVKAGDNIMIGDSTGFSTGSHLHFDLKFLNSDGSVKDHDNGYFGCVDPAPYFEKGYTNLPVDERYGRERDLMAEIILRFKNPWVHRRLIQKYRRRPLQLFDRECNAILYGGWGFDEALSDAMKPITYFLKKTEWEKGEKPYFKMII